MAEQNELREETPAQLAWAGQLFCLTAGPHADLEWWSLDIPDPLCQEAWLNLDEASHR